MAFFRVFSLFVLVGIPFEIFALDTSCFREISHIPVQNENPFKIMTTGVDSFSPPVFVENGRIIPSMPISSEKNPPISYTLSGSIDTIPIMDGDPLTHAEIDPYTLSTSDVVLDITLEKLYEKNTFLATFDYTTPTQVFFQVSSDGKSYFAVTRESIENFDMRYIRMTFRQTKIQDKPTWIRGISFYPNISLGYLVLSSGTGEVLAYRGSVCDPTEVVTQPFPSSYSPAKNSTMIHFITNPLYKNDTDRDAIENINDNCPYTSNPDQKDRNYDGRGDACTDDDHDGIIGNADNCPTVSNPDQSDKNVNTIGDACEFDTDKDGIPDSIDNAIHVPNPDQKDEDRDMIGDIMDNCNLYNPDQQDLDKNGQGDVCDRDREYRKNNDRDKDGIMDFSDNCSLIPNPDQADRDHDSVGDVCDNCLSLQNQNQTDANKNKIGDACDDTDNDGVEGWRDNCPDISNPDQKDSNNDGIGDACSDTDGDTIFDVVDNCPNVYNRDQSNIDADGEGDVCDQKDNRLLESNKYIFMGLIASFAVLFIGIIIFLLRKLR